MATITGFDDKDDKLFGTAAADVINGLMGKDEMTGGKGADVYFVDNKDDKIFEKAGEGIDLVKSTVSFTLADNVENLTLIGKANINAYGNAEKNILTGNEGNNSLYGYGGNDTMNGGKGDDIYFVEDAGDKVVETITAANGGGMDTVSSAIDFSLASLTNVENLVLTNSAHKATGNALNNDITGTGADNIIDGGKGADQMTGLGGDDTYYVDNAKDTVVEAAGKGNDTVISKIVFSGAIANVENYTFNTSAVVNFSGNSLDNTIKGGSGKDMIDGGGTGKDSLYGNAGNDTLSGGANADFLDGGTGADVMKGFASDDIYVVDNAKDDVIEQMANGDDTVITKITLAKLFENVEQLVLAEGKTNLNATGNELGNKIYGNAGNNVIDGGKGIDFMAGGDGNDTYIVDQMLDVVDEKSKTGGTDLVKSVISFSLSDNLENLTLTGTDGISGTGNSAKNVILGNAGKNFLDGKGGDDTLTGGLGDDTYGVDSKGDKVIEAAKGGTDTILSSIDYSLAALANIENLTLTGMALKATGNAFANSIHGNDADNDIDGGKGADFMHGGKGGDTYHVDDAKDVVDEMAGQGFDRVISTTNALTKAFDNVEYYQFETSKVVTFHGSTHDEYIIGGSANDEIYGEGGKDTLRGGAGNDFIQGGNDTDFIDGGTGKDWMQGGNGDDYYSIDSVDDVVLEFAGQTGIDEVDTTVSIDHLFQLIENIVLMGSGNLNASGNELDNTIYANNGKNALSGREGNDVLIGSGGDDTLTGGAGADKIFFNVDKSEEGHDTITDFVKAEDILWFNGVDDANNDGKINLNDLLADVASVTDHGAGKAVDVVFDSGASMTFEGVGTGAIVSLDALVANAATQIQINV